MKWFLLLFFTACSIYAEAPIPFRKGKLWGYSDRFGNLVFDAIYDVANPFYEGNALVKKNNCFGFISMTGKQYFSDEIENCSNFSEGLAALKLKTTKKWGFIDKNFLIAIKPVFEDVYSFSSGMAAVKLNGKWGFIDKKGSIIIPCQFDKVKSCTNKTIPVCKNGKWGFLNFDGSQLIPFSYKNITSFNEGIAGVSIDGMNHFYIDKSGKKIMKLFFEQCGIFYNGFAVVKSNGGYGVISKNGIWKIPPYYSYLSDFSDGLAVCSINSHYGYIDMDGNLVIPMIYTYAMPFNNGYGHVWMGKTRVKISGGAIIEQPIFDGYIDKNNRSFWK